MRIGFDIDGVVYDFHRAIYPALRYNGYTMRPFVHFWTCEVNGRPDIDRDVWKFLLSDRSFYENPPCPFIVERLQMLNLEHELWFITARPEALEKFTKEWFVDNAIPFSKIIFAEDKLRHMPKVDWFVEDNPHNAEKLAALTKLVVIHKPWNEHLRGSFPMYDHISQIKEF